MRILKILRALLGIGRADLAKRSGVSTRELSRLENGEAKPTRETFEAIDDAVAGVLDERCRRAK